jgi:hypothetical protein
VAHSGPVTLDEDNVRWSRLEFGAQLFLISLSADVEYGKVAAGEASEQFYDPEGKPLLMPGDGQVSVLTMDSDNFGRKSRVRFWFEPDLTALEVDKTESGRKNYVKAYRYAEDGVYRRDYYPLEGEKDLPYAQWSKIEYHEYPHPEELEDISVTDNAVLFYAASAANLAKPGDSLAFYTFGKKHLNRIELRVEAVQEIAVDYVEVGPNGERQVDETIPALRISVTPSSVGESTGENEFEFLGLKEDVKVYVDPRTRVPLQISARMNVVGSVSVYLKRVHLK